MPDPLDDLPDLPGCRWRGEPLCQGHYNCRSPRLRLHPGDVVGVPERMCAACPVCDHEPDGALRQLLGVTVLAVRRRDPC